MAIREVVGPAVMYLGGQMAAGRLRSVHPLLAIQSFIGPIAAHLLTREIAHDLVGYDEPLERTIDELVEIWLRGLRPEQGGVNDAE